MTAEDVADSIDADREERTGRKCPPTQHISIQDILRKRLLYLEGFASALEDTPRRSLLGWIHGTQKILNDVFPKDIV